MHLFIVLSISLLAAMAYIGSVVITKKPRNSGDEYEIIEDAS